METYFSKCPIINYANNVCRNITKRTKIVHTRLIDPDNYYPLELPDDMRADNLAFKLYSDQYLDWMMWLNNGIVDPYYGWHLSTTEFEAYINDKYGSIPIAQNKTAYYRTVWPESPGAVRITVSDFNYTIPGTWKKYYQPIYDNNGNILFYTPSYNDWRVNTNQIIQFNITMTVANTIFATGNTIQITSGGNVVGQVTVIESNSSILIAQHTSGNTSAPNGLQDMFNNTISATFSNTTILQTNIPITESVFWEGISWYDIEDEKNTRKKFVNVIDNGIALQVSSIISSEMAS